MGNEISVSDKVYNAYQDEGDCLGKMYDSGAGECKDCPDARICEKIQNGAEPVKASEQDVAEVFDKKEVEEFNRESLRDYILVFADESFDISLEVVAMKTRDKLYLEDSQLFVVTRNKLKIMNVVSGDALGLKKGVWEEAHKGITIAYKHIKAIKKAVSEHLSSLKKSVEGASEEDVEEVKEDLFDDEESSEEIEDKEPENLLVEKNEGASSVAVTPQNLERGVSVFTTEEIVKIEIYLRKDQVNKKLLMKKLAEALEFDK